MLLVFIFVLVVLGLVVLLWAGTLFFQGYIYTEPAPGLSWRAPAAGGVMGLLVITWCLLDYNDPGRYDALLFSSRDDHPFTEFWSHKQGTQEPMLFTRQGNDFLNPQYGKWRRSDSQGIMDLIIIPLAGGTKVEFKPELTDKGTFKIERGQPLRYVQVDGNQVITEMQLGLGSYDTFNTGLFWVNILLNLGHLALWFVVLWLLLRFQWSHALGLGLVLWLIMSVGVLPMLLEKMRDQARENTSSRATAEPASPKLGIIKYKI